VGLSLVLIAFVLGGGLCLLDDHGAGVDVCFLILAIMALVVPPVDLVFAGRVSPFIPSDPWLLLHPASPSPI
jgi:hypothetical protein